ncbi:hypothetical protein KsCSTR_18680 [Candidatus Kuenenia stuttgartiensis]|uniref:Uncharacterized protein n=1 Tax=Kuenenia stuttgartiensis TaxID=174633 RepID=A0A6G7GPX8_KUEST|nr:hypothetical protein KsCSTR_18680 [Candidatus Kuenenia stuttgartiensis]
MTNGVVGANNYSPLRVITTEEKEKRRKDAYIEETHIGG